MKEPLITPLFAESYNKEDEEMANIPMVFQKLQALVAGNDDFKVSLEERACPKCCKLTQFMIIRFQTVVSLFHILKIPASFTAKAGYDPKCGYSEFKIPALAWISSSAGILKKIKELIKEG